LVCAFIISTAIALHATSIVSFVKEFLPATMSGLAVIILLGRFWKRSTWQGAVAALVTTAVVSLGVLIFFEHTMWNNAIIPTAAGALAHVVVSIVTPPPTRTFAEVVAEMTSERESIEGNSSEIHLSTQPSTTPI
jgi:SSS family solute:Na+ symporter